jgi:Protein of unknown function (DUF3040)
MFSREHAEMSLTAREQRILDSIRARLADSDPALTQIMGTFTRLTTGEQMPAREQVRRRRPRRRRPARQRVAAGPVVALVWLLLSITLISLAVVLSRGPGTCRELSVAGCLPAGSGSLPAPGSAGHNEGSGDEARRSNAGTRLADGLYHVVRAADAWQRRPSDMITATEPAGPLLSSGPRRVRGAAM